MDANPHLHGLRESAPNLVQSVDNLQPSPNGPGGRRYATLGRRSAAMVTEVTSS